MLHWGKKQVNKIQAEAGLRFQTEVDMVLVILSPNCQCLIFKKKKGQQELHPENVIVINRKKQFIPYVKFNLNQLGGIANLMKLIH